MKEKGGIRYISSSLLEKYGDVSHAFLGRTGGVSAPPFDTLNFDARDTDAPANIAKNRELLSKALDIPVNRLVLLNQVHGDQVLRVDKGYDNSVLRDFDAVMTNVSGIPIGIMTADCLPVLIYDPVNKAIGASHAGWKGTVKSIAAKTILEMKRAYGTNPEDIIAALGPYIGLCCYSVKENVADEFMAEFGKHLSYFHDTGKDIRLDIGMANVSQLLSIGVLKENIGFQPVCTSCNNKLFFSYRKDGGRTGRQISFIMLR